MVRFIKHVKLQDEDTLIRVSVQNGVEVDNMYAMVGYTYTDKMYNKDGTRKEEYMGNYFKEKKDANLYN